MLSCTNRIMKGTERRTPSSKMLKIGTPLLAETALATVNSKNKPIGTGNIAIPTAIAIDFKLGDSNTNGTRLKAAAVDI